MVFVRVTLFMRSMNTTNGMMKISSTGLHFGGLESDITYTYVKDKLNMNTLC